MQSQHVKLKHARESLEAFVWEYRAGLAFIAGWTAYPVGVVLLSLLGIL